MTTEAPSPPTQVERALQAWIRSRVASKRPIVEMMLLEIRLDVVAGALPYLLTVTQYNPETRVFDVLDAVVEPVAGWTRADVWAECVSQLAAAAGGTLRFSATVVGDRLLLEVDESVDGQEPLLLEMGPTISFVEASPPGAGRTVSPVIYGRPGAPTPVSRWSSNPTRALLPSPEYWVVTGGDTRALGTEDEGEPDAELEYVENIRSKTQTLDLLIVSPRASSLASLFQGCAGDTIELIELSKLGLGIVDVRTVVDGSVRLATMWQQRAALSVEVAFSERSLFDARDRIIDTVEATGEVAGLPPVTINEPDT